MKEFLSSFSGDRPFDHWLLAFAYVAAGFFFGKLLAWFGTRVLRRLALKTKNRLDDILLAFAGKPLVFIVTLAGFKLGADSLELAAPASLWIGKIHTILLTAALTWAIVRVIDTIIAEYLVPYVEKSEGELDDQLLPILRNVIKTLAWGLAILVALRDVGYDVGALLAGLGIGGVAVALAAKDTLSNFFGSVAVLVDRPFRLNDRIKVAGLDGTVIQIGIRTSKLRTLDGRMVTIPNATFASSPIENVSSEPATRIAATLDLAPQAGAAGAKRAVAAVKAALASLPSLAEGSVAGISAFSEQGIRLSYVFFLRKDEPYLDTVSAANLAVLAALEAEGLPLAAPARVALVGEAPKALAPAPRAATTAPRTAKPAPRTATPAVRRSPAAKAR